MTTAYQIGKQIGEVVGHAWAMLSLLWVLGQVRRFLLLLLAHMQVAGEDHPAFPGEGLA